MHVHFRHISMLCLLKRFKASDEGRFPRKSRVEARELSSSCRWPQPETSACWGHVRVWHFVGLTGRACSFELFLQDQYFVHSYLFNFTWSLLWSIRTGQGEVYSPCLWSTVYLTVPHRTDPVTGASSITKPHVSHMELSGPGYIATLSPASSLTFHSHCPHQASASHWCGLVLTIDPSLVSPSAALCPLFVACICCISSMCK